MITLGNVSGQFAEYLHSRDLAPNTIRAYTHDVQLFLRDGPQRVSELTPERITRFLEENRQHHLATRHRRYVTLSIFCRWLVEQNLIQSDPMATIAPVNISRPPRSDPSTEAIAAIFAVIPARSLRDQALFGLLHQTGMLVNEVLALRCEDLILTPGKESIDIAVGSKRERRISLTHAPRLLTVLRQYLEVRGQQAGLLFPGNSSKTQGLDGPLHYTTVQRAWVGYGKRAGLQVDLHHLRSAYAHQLIKTGVALDEVRLTLGRASLQELRHDFTSTRNEGSALLESAPMGIDTNATSSFQGLSSIEDPDDMRVLDTDVSMLRVDENEDEHWAPLEQPKGRLVDQEQSAHHPAPRDNNLPHWRVEDVEDVEGIEISSIPVLQPSVFSANRPTLEPLPLTDLLTKKPGRGSPTSHALTSSRDVSWNIFARVLEMILRAHGYTLWQLRGLAGIHTEKISRLHRSLKEPRFVVLSADDLDRVIVACNFTPDEAIQVRAAVLATAVERTLMDRINQFDALAAGEQAYAILYRALKRRENDSDGLGQAK